MKKATAYLFLFLANMILLVHAVVPHHYHHSQVCIESKHDENHDAADEHDCTADHHEQDGNSTESCALKQVVVLPSNPDKQEYVLENSSHKTSADKLFSLFYAGTEPAISVFYKDQTIPDLLFSYTTCLKTSFGLRAPPTV